jgi:hypothetical protein
MSSEQETRPDGQETRNSLTVSKKQAEPISYRAAAGCEVPNGGYKAWLQVAGAFCLFFNTW